MSSSAIRLRAPGVDEAFRAFGTDVRLIVQGHGARAAVARARELVLDYHQRLSRFRPDSEICALNCDPRAVVPASSLLRSAVRAGLWAAERSDGLVDPCLLDALEAAGYTRSYEPDGRPAVLARPRRRRRAAADPGRRWRAVRVDDGTGVIARPPGLRLDLGGSGKGHAADLVAEHFAGLAQWVVDCGGDIRVGGRRAVEVAHPMRGGAVVTLILEDAAIATSSVVSRTWTTRDGERAHHLLDPRSGRPVWTGLLSATALASTTLEAETLAKIALLRGAPEARAALARHGGVLVHEDGAVETVGDLEVAP